MATFEDLEILQSAKVLADAVWKLVVAWDEFPRDTVGRQLVRAVDSIGANIAESYGRFHFGEKLQFLYYARGSLFETKYWLDRACQRQLLGEVDVINHLDQLTRLAKQLNAFAGSLKEVRYEVSSNSKRAREVNAEYDVEMIEAVLFSDEELGRLAD
jgi:four helix bundle protein